MNPTTSLGWYSLSECSYKSFYTADESNRLEIIQTASSMSGLFCPRQLTIIDDLFYRALKYSCDNNFDYLSTCSLFTLIENELKFISANQTEKKVESSSSLSRFQTTIKELSLTSVDNAKKMFTFLADNLFKYSAAFSFMLNEYPEENDFAIEVVIQTPSFPLPLSAGVDAAL